MDNSRRRKEILILGVLLGNAIEVVNTEKYRTLSKTGAFFLLGPLDELFKKAVPDDEARAKDLTAAKMVVNALLPSDYFKSTDEQKMWFACQFLFKLIQTGWRVPRGETEAYFVQSMYDLSTQMYGRITLPDNWPEAVEKAPTIARAHGYYG